MDGKSDIRVWLPDEHESETFLQLVEFVDSALACG